MFHFGILEYEVRAIIIKEQNKLKCLTAWTMIFSKFILLRNADLTIMELLMWKAECHIMFAAIVVLVLKCELVIADLFSRKLLVLPEFLRNSIYISSVIQ